MERGLAQAEQKHALVKQNHNNAQKVILDLQAGIEHLCGKLNEIRLEGGNVRIDHIESVTQ